MGIFQSQIKLYLYDAFPVPFLLLQKKTNVFFFNLSYSHMFISIPANPSPRESHISDSTTRLHVNVLPAPQMQ